MPQFYLSLLHNNKLIVHSKYNSYFRNMFTTIAVKLLSSFAFFSANSPVQFFEKRVKFSKFSASFSSSTKTAKLNLSPVASNVDSLGKDRTSFSSYSTAATERSTIKIIFLCCVLYIWVLVEESVATGISAMAVFVLFNGRHNYFKFQSYGTVTHKINVHKLLNRFLTVNEKDKF